MSLDFTFLASSVLENVAPVLRNINISILLSSILFYSILCYSNNSHFISKWTLSWSKYITVCICVLDCDQCWLHNGNWYNYVYFDSSGTINTPGYPQGYSNFR